MRQLGTVQQQKAGGFTLVEMLVVVALIAITAGVSTDIILSLVRTYSKTSITNEVDQVSNLAMLKIERELKDASVVLTADTDEISFIRQIDGTPTEVSFYFDTNGSLWRREGTIGLVSPEILIDSSQIGGVKLNPATSYFSKIQNDPVVIRIVFDFVQANDTATIPFTGNIQLENTVVLRGTYLE